MVCLLVSKASKNSKDGGGRKAEAGEKEKGRLEARPFCLCFPTHTHGSAIISHVRPTQNSQHMAPNGLLRPFLTICKIITNSSAPAVNEQGKPNRAHTHTHTHHKHICQVGCRPALRDKAKSRRREEEQGPRVCKGPIAKAGKGCSKTSKPAN